jgi:hypothetical protein
MGARDKLARCRGIADESAPTGKKAKKGRSIWSGQYPGKCLLFLLCGIAKRFRYSVKS